MTGERPVAPGGDPQPPAAPAVSRSGGSSFGLAGLWWWAIGVVAAAAWLHVDVLTSLRSGWWWLLEAAVLAGQWMLAAQVRARLPVGALRPLAFWVGGWAAAGATVTAVATLLGAPDGAHAVVVGLTTGPVVTVLAFAVRPRVHRCAR